MNIAAQADRLLKLAQARAPGDRERLLLAIADLCESASGAGALDAATVQALLNDIFMCLVMEAEREIRRRLAEKLAHAAWAPRALVNVLALDDIEIELPKRVLRSDSNLRMKHGDGTLGILGHLAADQIAQRKDHRIGNFVADGGAFSLAFYEMRVVQDRQLFRDVGLLHAAGFHEFIDGSRAGMQQLKQGQAAGFGQHGKQPGHSVKLAGRQGLVFSVGHDWGATGGHKQQGFQPAGKSNLPNLQYEYIFI